MAMSMRRPWATLVLGSAGWLLASPSVQAEEPGDEPDIVSTSPNPDGSTPAYQGVVPETHDEPAMAVPKGLPGQLTWAGFQIREGKSARIFVQFTAAPTYESTRDGDKFIVQFRDVTVFKRNNLRPIDARHFGTAVQRFRIRIGQRRMPRLEIEASGAQAPTVGVEKSGAFHYLFVDFAPPPASPSNSSSDPADDRERP